MARRPVRQPPFLNNLRRFVELDVFTGDVAVEDGEFAADVGAFELARCAACEDRDTLGIGECLVQLIGCGAHLVRGCDCGCPDWSGVGGRCRGCVADLGLILGGLGVDGGGTEASRRVDTRGVLEVFGVFGDQGVAELAQGN